MRTSLDVWLTGALAALLLTPWLLYFIMLEWVIPTWVLVGCLCCWRPAPATVFGFGLLTGLCWLTWQTHQTIAWQLPPDSWREPVTVTVSVSQPVVMDELRWRIDGRIIAASAPELIALPAGSRPLVRLHWYRPEGQVPEPGEQWQLTVRLRPLSGLLNEGAFNYQAWLTRHGYQAGGTVVAGHYLAGEPHWRYRLKQYLTTELHTLPHLGVLLALAMGERSELSDNHWRTLQDTGVAHLVAISGLHLTLVFGFALLLSRLLWALLGRLSMATGEPHAGGASVSLLLAWFGAVGYAALAGFAVPTIRALALVTVFCLYRLLGRRISPFRLLLRAVLLVLLLDPFAWLDRGFWLSAGAVFAIMVWHWRLPQPHWASWRGKLVGLWRLEVMLTLCLAPLTILWFEGISLVAPLTNLVAVPLVSMVVLPLVLVSVTLSLLAIRWHWPWAEHLAGVGWRLANNLLEPLWQFLSWCQQLPVAWWSNGQAELAVWLLLALMLAYLPWHRGWRLLGLASLLLGLFAYHQVQRPPEFAIHVLDVGQGLAVVVQREQFALVYDTGPAYPSGFNLGSAVVIPFLEARGLEPDYLVFSHAHQDHIGGAEVVQAAYPGAIVLGSGVGDWPCEHGQQWLWRDVRVRALARLPGSSRGPNNDSCVLQLEYSGQRILLPGDIEEMSELRLSGRHGDALRSQVMLVPHHGSRTSSQPEFLAAVQPELAVVSRGFLNRFGMPHRAVRERYCEAGIPLYDTGRSGQISLYWRHSGWQVVRYREDRRRRWYHEVPAEFAAVCQL